MERITLDHGSGGLLTKELVQGRLIPRITNPLLAPLEDSAVLELGGHRLAFTTDSYVVRPLFFPGGDIGRLAVFGTVNDLAMKGARPLALSLALVLEEGLPIEILDRILESVGEAARAASVPVATGDTKVVERGKADGLYVNTAGIGLVPEEIELSPQRIAPGDRILVSGPVGDHGAAILISQEGLGIESGIESDAMPLHRVVEALIQGLGRRLHALRDPTRGGLATLLSELASASGRAFRVEEGKIPVRPEVEGASELLGIDPLYLASEGRLVAFVEGAAGEEALRILKSAGCEGASLIGAVEEGPPGRVVLETHAGGERLMRALSGRPLPRIC